MPDAFADVRYFDSTRNAAGHEQHFEPGAECFFLLISQLKDIRDNEIERVQIWDREREIARAEIAAEREAIAQLRSDLEARLAEFQETAI